LYNLYGNEHLDLRPGNGRKAAPGGRERNARRFIEEISQWGTAQFQMLTTCYPAQFYQSRLRKSH
jgi:hypothetical protein